MKSESRLATVELRRFAAERAKARARHAATELEDAIVAAADSGATQRQIAARAGVSQPYVAKVVGRSRRFEAKSTIGAILASKRDDVLRLLHALGVTNVAVFGSVANGTDGPESDLDLLADVPEDVGLFALARLEADLSDLLGVNVDLVPRRVIKPAVREAATRAARL